MHPNLLVIGGIKCGTTSLHSYLDEHPEISMSERKELHYFSRPDWPQRQAWYEQQFERFDTPVRGEATPHYTWHPHVRGIPDRIYSVIPEAKLIYLVRDPVERILSHRVQLLAQGNRKPFEAFLRESGWRDNLLVCPSRYATQVERYLELFPASQLLVVDQHDLKVDRRATLREIFRFLGVDDGFVSPGFELERNTRAEKYALTRVGMPVWNRALGPAVRRLPSSAQDPVRRLLLRLLSRKITTQPVIEPDLRPRLESMLKDEADRLRAITGKQFASWSL